MQTYNTLKKKLILGNEYSYPDLCRLIKEPIKTGGSKQKQLRIWKSHFDYEYNDSDKTYRITKLYSHPKEPEKKPSPKRYKKKEKGDDLRRQGNNSKYSPYIKKIVVDELLKYENHSVELTISELMKLCGIVNDNFFTHLSYKQIAELMDVNVSDIKYFFENVKRSCVNAINNSLNSLEKNKLITCEKVYYIVESDEQRRATAIEELAIEDAKERSLKELGYETERDIFMRQKMMGYYKKVNKNLRDVYDIDRCYKKVTLKYIGESADSLTLEERDSLREGLNKTFFDAFLLRVKKSEDHQFCIMETLLSTYVKTQVK